MLHIFLIPLAALHQIGSYGPDSSAIDCRIYIIDMKIDSVLLN